MKKNIVKSLYSFGTAVLAFGTLATASMPIVSATTVSSSQEAAVSQVKIKELITKFTNEFSGINNGCFK